MDYTELPPPEDDRGYNVKEACQILELKPAQVCRIFQKEKITKNQSKYFVSAEKLIEIKNRKNRCLKDYDF